MIPILSTPSEMITTHFLDSSIFTPVHTLSLPSHFPDVEFWTLNKIGRTPPPPPRDSTTLYRVTSVGSQSLPWRWPPGSSCWGPPSLSHPRQDSWAAGVATAGGQTRFQHIYSVKVAIVMQNRQRWACCVEERKPTSLFLLRRNTTLGLKKRNCALNF